MLTKSKMYDDFKARVEQIEAMFLDGTPQKKIFDELCCSIYSGDEWNRVSGILETNNDVILDALCHHVIDDYLMCCVLDSSEIRVPDTGEITVKYCAQLKRNGISFETVIDHLKKTDVNDVFASNSNEFNQVASGLKEAWDCV